MYCCRIRRSLCPDFPTARRPNLFFMMTRYVNYSVAQLAASATLAVVHPNMCIGECCRFFSIAKQIPFLCTISWAPSHIQICSISTLTRKKYCLVWWYSTYDCISVFVHFSWHFNDLVGSTIDNSAVLQICRHRHINLSYVHWHRLCKQTTYE